MKKPASTMLDDKDRELIRLLQQDGRQSLEALAGQLSVSIPTVSRRIEKLTRGGIIRITGAVDPAKVGAPLSVMTGLVLAPSRSAAVLRELGRHPATLVVMRTIGRFDALASLWFRSTQELSEFVETGLPAIRGIKGRETFLLLRNAKAPFTTLSPALMQLEDTDLVSLLQEDGRRTNAELAATLGISRSTVGRRIQRLLETGILRVAAFPAQTASEVHAAVAITTEPGRLKAVTAAAAGYPEVRWLSTCTGRYDLFAMTVFKSNEEMSDFIADIGRLPGVEHTEVSLIMETHLFYEARHKEYWASRRPRPQRSGNGKKETESPAGSRAGVQSTLN